MTFIEPLNLQIILVNFLAGNKEVFTFMFIAFIAALAGRFRMPNAILLVIVALLPILLATYISSYWLIVTMMIGGFFVWGIIRAFGR